MGIVERLGALVMRALDEGHGRVQVERAEGKSPGCLLLGQASAPQAFAIEVDEASLEGDGPGFGALLGRLEAAQASELQVITDPAWLQGQPIETMAREYLGLRKVEEQVEAVRAALLVRMREQGRMAIDVPGVGAVILQPGKPQNRVDNDAVKKLLADLAARLRAHGEEVVMEIPRAKTDAKDGIKVTWAR